MKGGRKGNALSYVKVSHSLLKATSPIIKQNLEIKYVTNVNASVKEEEFGGTHPRGIKVHW